MDRMENEIQTLSRALFKGQTPPPGSLPASGTDQAAQANLEVRLGQLEQEVRVLTGRVEEQDFALRRLDEKMTNGFTGIEARMSGMQARAAGTASNAAPAPAGSLGQEYPALPSPLAPAPANAAASAAGANSGTGKTDVAGDLPAPADAPTAGKLGALAQNDEGSYEGLSGGPADLYEQAFSHLRDKSYDEAEQGFTAFLAKYPDHSLAPNAKYWLGESYYARNQFERAARVFAEAYQQYPKGPKGPDNLLKLALSLAGMGKKEDACLTLAQIRKEYAAGPNPVLARADSERENLNCPQ